MLRFCCCLLPVFIVLMIRRMARNVSPKETPSTGTAHRLSSDGVIDIMIEKRFKEWSDALRDPKQLDRVLGEMADSIDVRKPRFLARFPNQTPEAMEHF